MFTVYDWIPVTISILAIFTFLKKPLRKQNVHNFHCCRFNNWQCGSSPKEPRICNAVVVVANIYPYNPFSDSTRGTMISPVASITFRKPDTGTSGYHVFFYYDRYCYYYSISSSQDICVYVTPFRPQLDLLTGTRRLVIICYPRKLKPFVNRIGEEHKISGVKDAIHIYFRQTANFTKTAGYISSCYRWHERNEEWDTEMVKLLGTVSNVIQCATEVCLSSQY